MKSGYEDIPNDNIRHFQKLISARVDVIKDLDENELENNGIRCHEDFRNEKISYKVREHSAAKVPVIMALGKREKESQTVSIRRIGSDKTKSMSLKDALKALTEENSIPS